MASHQHRVELVATLAAVKGLLRRVRRHVPDRRRSGGLLLLAVLCRTGPIRLRDLADEAALDLSVVSRLVTELAREGCVERREHPQDSRSRLLAVTIEGERRYQAALHATAEALDPALRDWKDEDVAHLSDLLVRLHLSIRSQAERNRCRSWPLRERSGSDRPPRTHRSSG
jgi:DNA-binding MarR family transcriptional regulator